MYISLYFKNIGDKIFTKLYVLREEMILVTKQINLYAS